MVISKVKGGKTVNYEKNLIQEAIEGSHDSFNQLLNPYIKRAHQTAYLLLRDYGLAEDAVQETLIETLKSLKRFNSEKASFKTWFNGILVNTSLKVNRKKRFSSRFKDDKSYDRSVIPETNYLLKEETKLILDAIKQLNTKHQTVVILHYFQEFSIHEISETLNIKEGTIKSRLHNARAKLKNLLLEKEVMIYGTKTEKNIK